MNDYKLAIELIKTVNSKEKNFVTGYRDLDACVGYTPKGSLITIGGRPAMGKTSLTCGMVLNMLKEDKSILYLSLDLSKELLERKLLFMQAKIQPSKINLEPFSEADFTAIEKAADFLGSKNLEIVDKTSADTDFIQEKAKQNKYDYIFINVFQMIRQKKGDVPADNLGQVVKDLKRIARENNVTIILTSNLSRKIERRVDKVPTLSDLQDDGTLEDLSDVVIFIYRYDYYDFEDTRFDNTELFIAKNKFNLTGFVELHFDKEFAVFEDIPRIDIF